MNTDQGIAPRGPLQGTIWAMPVGGPEENRALVDVARRVGEALRAPLQMFDGMKIGALKTGLTGPAPRLVLLPESARRLAEALAHQLGGVFCPGCRDIAIRTGTVEVDRLIYRERVQARFALPVDQGPWVVTLPSPVAPSAPSWGAGTSFSSGLLDELAGIRAVTVFRRFRVAPRELDLAEADIIVAGGRGVGDAAHWRLVESLADVLNAAVAGTRVAMDCGWVPRERMVGESGRSVSPKLYVAVGISGAPQHVAGMRHAAAVVAINKDKNAPIFSMADIRIVGDLHQILPALVAKIAKAREPSTCTGA